RNPPSGSGVSVRCPINNIEFVGMAFRKKQHVKSASRNRGTNLADKHPRALKPAPMAAPRAHNSHPAQDGENRLQAPALEQKRVPALANDGHPERERGSYDADTAIKLYL